MDDTDDFQVRFRGIARLVGSAGLGALRASRVAVVGLGGVGSWAAEALARSGVGHLVLMDLDEVCLGNVNRQIPALDGTIGRFKVEVMAERLRAIQPGCSISPRVEFFTARTQDSLFEHALDAVVDAIDDVANKARLIAACVRRGITVVVCGAAGGRLDPTRIVLADLAEVTHDPLLASVRKRLRRDHGLGQHRAPIGVACVCSKEPPAPIQRCEADSAADCNLPPEAGTHGRRLNCEAGYGSAAFVTGAFGLAAAAEVVRFLTRPRVHPTDIPCR